MMKIKKPRYDPFPFSLKSPVLSFNFYHDALLNKHIFFHFLDETRQIRNHSIFSFFLSFFLSFFQDACFDRKNKNGWLVG